MEAGGSRLKAGMTVVGRAWISPPGTLAPSAVSARLPRLALIAALLTAVPGRAQDDSGAFAISGIAVDVAGKTAIAAREGGWREAQRKAWPQLWSRLTGAPAVNAPKLGDSALDAIVQAIEVEHEAVGPNRYIARLGVVFDRARASRYLGASARMLRSSPMLLMPVLIDGGTRTAYEKRTIWAAAWARFRTDSSPVDYVRAPGTAGDAVILTAAQAYRPDRTRWRSALQRYAASDVLVAEAMLVRSWPGGPVTGRFRALHGPDDEPLGGFVLNAASEGEVPAMLDTAARKMDELYTQALREGRLHADEDLTVALTPVISSAPDLGVAVRGGASIEAEIETPTPEAASAIEDKVRIADGVLNTGLTSVAYGGTSRLKIVYGGGLEQMRYGLDQLGLRLEQTGGRWRLRSRRTDEAPLPRPVPPVPVPMPADTTGTTEAVPGGEGAPGPGIPGPQAADAVPPGL